MKIDDKIRDEKIWYNINRKAAKISELSSGNIDQYGYLTGEEKLPSNLKRVIEQAKFTCSPLGKTFEKQIKTMENLDKKTNKSNWRAWKTVSSWRQWKMKNKFLKNIYSKIL